MQKKIAFDPLLPSPTLVRVTKPLSVLSALGQGYGVGGGGGGSWRGRLRRGIELGNGHVGVWRPVAEGGRGALVCDGSYTGGRIRPSAHTHTHPAA